MRSRQVDPPQELKSRVEWIGRRWLLRAWGRALPLVITRPGIRQSIKDQFNWPPDVLRKLGYASFDNSTA